MILDEALTSIQTSENHARVTYLSSIQTFYSQQFCIGLSELFRIFKDDKTLEARLKSTPKERIEFREKVRHIFAKGQDFKEVIEIFIPYMTASWAKWINEFQIVFKFCRELIEAEGPQYEAMMNNQINFIEAYLEINPVKIPKDK
jgi:hypothetical protein